MRILENIAILLLICQSFLAQAKSIPRGSTANLYRRKFGEIRKLGVGGNRGDDKKDKNSDKNTPAPNLAPSGRTPTTAAPSITTTGSPTASPSVAPSVSTPAPSPSAGTLTRNLAAFTIELQGTQDQLDGINVILKEALEEFLTQKLIEMFPSLLNLFLEEVTPDSEITRQIQAEDFRFVGGAVFPNADDAPTEKEVQDAQQQALSDLSGLKLILEDKGFDGDITGVTIDVDTDDEVSIDEETKDVDENDDENPDNVIESKGIATGTVIWVAVVVLVFVVAGFVGYSFKNRRSDPDGQSAAPATNEDLLADTSAANHQIT